MAKKKFRFDFAISFAGPQRDIARTIRNELVKKGFKVFFDEDFETEMFGKDGLSYMRKIYSEESRYCIVLVSKEYDKRDWTNLEREMIEARELKSGHNIVLPILTSDYKPAWLSSKRIYFNLKKRSIEELIKILVKKASPSMIDDAPERKALKKNPYKGLIPYDENDKDLFYGRENEVRNLFKFIMNNSLIVVMGKFGIGKTSLLNAGVFPKLRENNFLPIRIRLNYAEDAPRIMEQINQAIMKKLNDPRHVIQLKSKVEDKPTDYINQTETLWEHFHRFNHFDEARNKNVTPVLVFDQFEEIFTLGKLHPDRGRVIKEIYWLIENQIPDTLENKIYNIDISYIEMPDVRVVISLREEYLPHLTEFNNLIPSIDRVKFRVTALNGKQAREIIGMPGGFRNENLVNGILRYFYPEEVRDNKTITISDEKLEIEPLSLSLLCHQLFEKHPIKSMTKGDLSRTLPNFFDSVLKEHKKLATEEDMKIEMSKRLLDAIDRLVEQINSPESFKKASTAALEAMRKLKNGDIQEKIKSNFSEIRDMQTYHLNRVVVLLSRWLAKIQSNNAVSFSDINRVSEDIARNLLNEIYGYQLANLNYEKSNYPGIDLGDKHNKIAFQITARTDTKKIKESLEKFIKGPKDIYSKGIRFLILGFKKPRLSVKKYKGIYPGFDADQQILTVKDLIREINSIYEEDRERFYRIKDILENEFRDMEVEKRKDEKKAEDFNLVKCPACNGTRQELCVFCKGTGMIENTPCHNCDGTGKTDCSYCGGKSGLVSLKERNEYIEKLRYNIDIKKFVELGNYYQALLTIQKAESNKIADNNTRALKEKVIKSLSDDEEQSFKRTTKEGKTINYPEAGSTLGRDETIDSVIEILDKTPIVTVYGIPGIGKSVFIHQIRKNEPHNNRLYKRVIAKPGMNVNDLFQQLALLLGCRDMLNRPEFDLSKQSDFAFLETEAQYRVASLIHLDDAQHLFHKNQFRNNAVKEFLVAVTRYYPDTRIILECRIVPPAGIFPEKLHQSIRIHGIDEGSMILYFKQPFKNNLDFGWELKKDEQGLVLKKLCSKKKENIHPLAMVLLSKVAFQLNETPVEILKNPYTLKRFIDESEDLILSDLNKTTLQVTGPNMSNNIKMYREDIPAYLSISLQECIRELMGDAEIENLLAASTIVDKRENELRIAVSKKLYKEGQEHLLEIIKRDKERKERLKEEYGYIYDFNKLEIDENRWTQKQGQIEWRRKLWKILSKRNHFILDNIEENIEEPDAVVPDQPQSAETVSPSKPNYIREGKPPVLIGAELETPALELFEKFLVMCRNDFKIDILKKRRQPSGFQYGYDLEFACQIEGERNLKLRIECKNYEDWIKLDDIAGKLATAKLNFSNDPIDHWIVISPNAKIASDLNNCLNSWEESAEYPFKVQVWNQETGVDQLFGLVPEIYDIFYKPTEGHLHPKDWLEEEKQELLNFWMKKLEPPLRLPIGWEDYLRQPGKLPLEPKEIEFEKRCNNNDYVELNCKDETGAELAQTLEEKIYDWLEEPGSLTIFLLGEFGDGKTFFTYVLTRKLVEKFRESPDKGWLPVRFALKNFSRSYDPDKPKNIQDFLQHRLNELRTDIAGWNELRSSGYKILAILDGFDEISKELDPETIQRNIDILINFYENDYFSDMKILITSRKHFFENHKEKEWLIDKLDKPQLVHLAPIDRKITEDYLRKYAAGIGKEEKFNKLKDFHDPIGLASKPLFLDMVQVSLENLPEEDLNEYTLYETYILESLKRKENFLHDKRKETPKHKIIENLLKGLELVAQELHRSRKEFVYLSEIKGKKDLKEWLWTLSEPDEKTTVDETGRMAARSLLKRFNVKDQPKGKSWPVDFCHRSMREYFVARAVCNLLENNMEEAETFLIDCFLTHEILFFAGEIMEHRTFDYESRLLDLIRKTRNIEKIDRIKLGYLGGNAVNLLYQYKGNLPGDDWKNLVLDGAILPGADLSGKDFSGTSLQYANLDNVNFANSNFSNCNLTEVRIEETTPVQSIAVSTGEKILSLYHDGIIREWSYQRPHGASSTNLSGNTAEKEMKLMALPGNDLTVLHDRFLYFYDRNDLNLDLKAAIEIRPNIRLIKATRDYLLLNEEDGKKNRLLLVDLNKEAIVKSFICVPFTLCDHLDDCALVIFNQNEDLQLIDITPVKRTPLVISTGQKVACISTCKCDKLPGQYLLGLGLYNGTVQVWQIQVDQWKSEKILDQLLHEPGKPVKDICFIDECRIVTGGLDKTIKLLTFNPDGEPVGDTKEFKMTLQCQGMKIDGVVRDKIEGKKLKELIDKATK
jgi:hypothetical protein